MNEEEMLERWSNSLRITPEQHDLLWEYVREFKKRNVSEEEAYQSLLKWATQCQTEGWSWEATLRMGLLHHKGLIALNRECWKSLLGGDLSTEKERSRFPVDPQRTTGRPSSDTPCWHNTAHFYLGVKLP